MNEQLERLLNKAQLKKSELPELYTLLLKEYNKDVGEFLHILLRRSNSKAINYFFSNAKFKLNTPAMVEYLKGNFKGIIDECVGGNSSKKKQKVCTNMLSIIGCLKDISKQDTLDLTLLVLDVKLFSIDILKRFGESLIVKKRILNYDYSKLSNIQIKTFERYYKQIFEEQTMCQKELESYSKWLTKYGSKNTSTVVSVFDSTTPTTPPTTPIATPKPQPQPPVETVEKPIPKPSQTPTSVSNSNSNSTNASSSVQANQSKQANPSEVYNRLESLVTTESEHIAKLEKLMESLEAVTKLTAELESVKGERDSLKSTVEDLETQLKEVRLAVSMEKSLSEQAMVTLKTDIKNALRQPHNDYMDMRKDETIDKFCLGTIGNIFKILSKYGITL